MGYCVDMDISVKIPLSKEKEIKKAFKLLESQTQQNGGGYGGGKKLYSWVSEGFSKLSTVEEMFEEWRYEVTRTDTHFVVEYFSGEKLGDDGYLWKAMESVVDPSSVIELTGEDGSHWKYTFKKNKFNEAYGTVSYDDEEEDDPTPKKKVSKEKSDPYKILGVKKSATKQEINLAYKTLIKKYHPDKFSELGAEFEEVASTKTKELNDSRDYCLSKAKG